MKDNTVELEGEVDQKGNKGPTRKLKFEKAGKDAHTKQPKWVVSTDLTPSNPPHPPHTKPLISSVCRGCWGLPCIIYVGRRTYYLPHMVFYFNSITGINSYIFFPFLDVE
jgi:hypothetical protein